MKKIIGILLIGLMGFLGCSDSDDTTRTVDQATPVAPWAIIETSTPTYEWTPVQYATKYRLIVQNTNQESTTQDNTENYIIDEWYTAEEADCTSEESLCMVTPDTEVIGKNEFKVQACANEECGLWGETLTFDFTALNGPRFTDHGDGTVTDNNTKLMWTKNANLSAVMTWPNAMSYCEGMELADHSDWRLPTIRDWNSLIDRSELYPALPDGHPFTVEEVIAPYWSSTPVHEPGYSSDAVWIVAIEDGEHFVSHKSDNHGHVWPVRSSN